VDAFGTPGRSRTVTKEHGLPPARFDDGSHLGKIGARRHDGARPHPLEQGAKRALHVIEVAVDVGVIEFDRVQQQRIGIVVEELGALVEEGRVVLVALGDEPRPGPEPEVVREVPAGTAYHETRVAAGLVQHPRQQRARGRLAVRSDDDGATTVAHEEPHERFGHRAVRNPGREHRLDLGIAARHRVADDHEIGSRLEILGAIALAIRNAEIGEERAHRRVDGLIGARHVVSDGAQHAGERRHSDPRDGDQMNVARRRRNLRTRRRGR